jgi:hypothetical protein
MQQVLNVLTESISYTIYTQEKTTNNNDKNNKIEDNNNMSSRNQAIAAALDLIHFLAYSNYKRLLAPYFTKILVFHSGMKSKLMTAAVLSKSGYNF